MKKALCLVACAALAGMSAPAVGQVCFNEVFINPPGADQGYEWFELKSDAPNFSMNGLTLLVIEGEVGATNAEGTIDVALSLNGMSTGSNGLFIWRDGLVALNPSVDPATTVFTQDFNPDLENGSNTFLLVEGFTGAVGQDLDVNSDEILDAAPWTRVLCAIGYMTGEQRDIDREYATQLGGTDLTDYIRVGTLAFTPDTIARYCDGWLSHDLLGANPGPWFADPGETLFVPDNGQTLPGNYTLTPGSANTADCPPPGCDGDVNCDFALDGFDVETQEKAVGGDTTDYCQADPDFNGDFALDGFDVESVEVVVGGGACP